MAGKSEVGALTGKRFECNLFSSFVLWQGGRKWML